MSPAADGTPAFAELLGYVDRLLSTSYGFSETVERKYTDVVADLLGFLAHQMTALHTRRQVEIRQFFHWLEEQLGCPIEALVGKGVVREYYAQPDGVDALLGVLERNCPGQTPLDVRRPHGYRERNSDRERIIEGYERSVRVLRPILRQLELTDCLIDQIVYRLYGLSPDEIALVEQSTIPP